MLAGFALLAGLITASQALAAPDETALVSRASGPDGASGNFNSGEASISADGRFVAFASEAINLHPDGGVFGGAIFVRDLKENTTVIASRAPGSDGEIANATSGVPSISAEGRFVAFHSHATNLDPDAAQGGVFVRDLEQHTTTLVSRASGPDGEKGSGDAALFSPPSISADGRFVAFASCARNLHPDATNTRCPFSDGWLGRGPDPLYQVFVRDLEQHTTTLVSRASGGAGPQAEGNSWTPSISADGRFVAFHSRAPNLHPDAGQGGVFVRDLEENTTILAGRGATSPSIAANGRFVAFDGLDSTFGVFVRDLQERTTTHVSRTSGPCNAPANGGAGAASISPDGRFVAFQSPATNLAPDATDGRFQTYVRDLEENTTALASRASGAEGAPANRSAAGASLSARGRFVAFTSEATNLHPNATDGRDNVFRRELSETPPPPVDAAYLPAQLEVERARVRKDGMVVVRGSLDPIAAGQRVLVRFTDLARTMVVTVGEDGQFRLRRPARGARAGRIGLKLTFSAFATLRAASQRIRAARRPAGLRIGRAALRGNRLIVAGRVRPRARGQVRVLVEFNRPDCSPARIANRVRVNKRGRFHLRREIPPAVRDLGARVSVIHPGRGRFYGQRLGRNVGG